jgi:hypothetical protein
MREVKKKTAIAKSTEKKLQHNILEANLYILLLVLLFGH